MLWQATVCIAVGLLWGCTNPLIKRGAARVEAKLRSVKQPAAYSSLLLHLTTLAFIVPQLLNLAGSVVFASQLGSTVLAVTVPTTNAISLAANAVMDVALGARYRLPYLLPGLLLIVGGLALCTL